MWYTLKYTAFLICCSFQNLVDTSLFASYTRAQLFIHWAMANGSRISRLFQGPQNIQSPEHFYDDFITKSP